MIQELCVVMDFCNRKTEIVCLQGTLKYVYTYIYIYKYLYI